ncbi:MAG: LLM class flavin-dependent oxidoreductase [Thermodesulfobacteriota bacterium]|jgi:alkanesulfonate monooxygenase SsuD/methylene tetrahydromethanopterin reductase-like flavin-dependent oxidoreductase (luciferase family)
MQKPAVGLAAVPGRRKATLELVHRLEREGFSGVYCHSVGDNMGLCTALAVTTHEIPFGTSIANIYTRHPFDYAQTAAFIHELSNGRFRFGIGVSHGPVHQRLGLQVGKPLDDVRKFINDLRVSVPQAGALPPVLLAALRKPMARLAGEIADGAIWANAARSHMAESIRVLPPEKVRGGSFIIANMIPTCIAEDRATAAAVHRRTLTNYVRLPNYQQYWIEAGFADEMHAIQEAVAKKEDDKIPRLMSDRWLQQVTLSGTAAEVREGIAAWYDAGVSTLILVPSSARGNQLVACEELIAALR